MSRHVPLILAILFGPGIIAPSALGQAPPSAERPPAAPPEFKVVYWYDRRDPLNTFQWQVYDLRKGQYTPAVDAWLDLVKTRYPHYRAYVKEVARASDLVAAILDEHRATGGPYTGLGIFDLGGIGHFNVSGGYSRGYTGLFDRRETNPFTSPSLFGRTPPGDVYRDALGPSPGSGAYQPPAPTYLYPVPYPYPRPHP